MGLRTSPYLSNFAAGIAAGARTYATFNINMFDRAPPHQPAPDMR